jgi:hypothetical protein
MASIIWCDRTSHVVEESREEVLAMIKSWGDKDFIFVTPTSGHPRQVALRVGAITSFYAAPGSEI